MIVNDNLSLILEHISCLVIAGGFKLSEIGLSTVAVLTDDLGFKQLPDLPQEIDGSSVLLHNGTIVVCGGWKNKQMCLKLDKGIWKLHSYLNEKRICHSAVTTKRATFIF